LESTVLQRLLEDWDPTAEFSDVVLVEATRPDGRAAMVFCTGCVGVPGEGLAMGSFFDPETGQQNIA
jgi:hypothetical protein